MYFCQVIRCPDKIVLQKKIGITKSRDAVPLNHQVFRYTILHLISGSWIQYYTTDHLSPSLLPIQRLTGSFQNINEINLYFFLFSNKEHF